MPKIVLDPVRLKRQEEIGERWRQARGRGTLEAVTGFGKTTVGLLVCRKVVDTLLSRSQIPRIYVIVPTIFLKEQWEEKLVAWDLDTFVDVWVVNSFVLKIRPSCDLLIIDEIHRYTGEVFNRVFRTCPYQWCLGLTATLPEDTDKRQALVSFCPIIDTVSLEEAKRNKWVSEFSIYNLEVQLNEAEKEKYLQIDRNFGKYFGYFGHSFETAMECMKSQSARDRFARSRDVDPQMVRIYALNWRRAMTARQTFLHTCESKLDVAASIFQKVDFTKGISFNQIVSGADLLTERLGVESASYHSKVKARIIAGKKYPGTRVKEAIMDSFKRLDGEIKILNTAKALDQGADIPHIDLAVVVSGSSTTIQTLQRWGRAIRAVEGKNTRIVELFALGTQDERWMTSRQKMAPPGSIIHISDVSEIV